LPWIGPFPVLEGPGDNNNYKDKFGTMFSSIHPLVTRSQLKLYLFPSESMYLCTQANASQDQFPFKSYEKKWVVERIVDDEMKN
jgi:hypothetical protein